MSIVSVYTVKCQNSSISSNSVSKQFNCKKHFNYNSINLPTVVSKYPYSTRIILFSINHLFELTCIALSISNDNSFICTQLNGSKYPYFTRIILFSINHLFKLTCIALSISNDNSFICTQLNGSKYPYFTRIILFSIICLNWLV